MAFCLPAKEVSEFIKALRDGRINPEKLSKMSSADRQTFFQDIVGKDNAKDVNALFESKLLLKHQKQGFITWAQNVAGMAPKAKRDLISRVERMEKVLTAESEAEFLKDLAEQKLGVNVSFEEAQAITDLTNKVKETRTANDGGEEKRMEYGFAQVALKKYIENLKINAQRLTLKDIVQNPLRIPEAIASNAKAIQASMDDSAIFRQGWKTMWTHPGIWSRNALKSFRDIYVTFRDPEAVMDTVNADIMSRPTYNLMQKGKLDVGVGEEAFPTSLPEKIPYVGRVYKASENAYSAFVRRTRADVFDKYIDIARKSGVELTDVELQSIGEMVNSLTGRGNKGIGRAGKVLNVAFFSPKLLQAHIDTLIHPVTGAGGSSFVRRQATINLVKMAAGTAAVLTIARALNPNAVELDPRSSDFGKIKVGSTRFEVMGGMSSLLVLLSRIATQQTKSTASGKLSSLTDPKFGKDNLLDVIERFFENKLAPAAGVVRDFAKGETFEGRKPTVAGEAISLFTPMPAKTLTSLLRNREVRKDPRFVAFAEVLDMLGVAVNVHDKNPKGKKKPDIDFGKLLEGLKEADLDKILDTDGPTKKP